MNIRSKLSCSVAYTANENAIYNSEYSQNNNSVEKRKCVFNAFVHGKTPLCVFETIEMKVIVR